MFFSEAVCVYVDIKISKHYCSQTKCKCYFKSKLKFAMLFSCTIRFHAPVNSSQHKYCTLP